VLHWTGVGRSYTLCSKTLKDLLLVALKGAGTKDPTP